MMPSWKMRKRLSATKQRELRLHVLLTIATPFSKVRNLYRNRRGNFSFCSIVFLSSSFSTAAAAAAVCTFSLIAVADIYSALFAQEPATKQKSFGFGRLGNLPAANLHVLHDWNGRHAWHSTVYILSRGCTLHTAFCLLLDAGGGHCHLPGTAQGAFCGCEGRQVDSCVRLLLGLVSQSVYNEMLHCSGLE